MITFIKKHKKKIIALLVAGGAIAAGGGGEVDSEKIAIAINALLTVLGG
jgi:hypothetical protein